MKLKYYLICLSVIFSQVAFGQNQLSSVNYRNTMLWSIATDGTVSLNSSNLPKINRDTDKTGINYLYQLQDKSEKILLNVKRENSGKIVITEVTSDEYTGTPEITRFNLDKKIEHRTECNQRGICVHYSAEYCEKLEKELVGMPNGWFSATRKFDQCQDYIEQLLKAYNLKPSNYEELTELVNSTSKNIFPKINRPLKTYSTEKDVLMPSKADDNPALTLFNRLEKCRGLKALGMESKQNVMIGQEPKGRVKNE